MGSRPMLAHQSPPHHKHNVNNLGSNFGDGLNFVVCELTCSSVNPMQKVLGDESDH